MVKNNVGEIAKRGPGRPTKNKRGTFKFRVTDTLRTTMEAAAKESNRSVSEEIEHRLERSFAVDLLLTQLSGGGKNAAFLRGVAVHLSGLDQQAAPWHSSPESAARLLEQIRQEMEIIGKADTREEAVGELIRLSGISDISDKAGMLTGELMARSAPHAAPSEGKKRRSKDK